MTTSERAFEDLVAPYRAELHAHCYRMLGSVHDAEDALQEALVRAWRGLARFEGRSSVRAWLYAITTNTALTHIDRRSKRVLPVDLSPGHDVHDEPRWIEPYPDDLVDGGYAGPAARYERRESVELAFVVALQHLPARQRAVLILRDVLGFSAREAAHTLEATPVAVNSALQRARRTIDERLPERSQQAALRALGDRGVREIVDRYMDALDRADVDAVVSLLAEDATWSMPPFPAWYQGIEAITGFLHDGPMRERWRHLPAHANGQAAVGCYSWDAGAGAYRCHVLDVLTLRDHCIEAITAFVTPELFAAFGLPAQLPPLGVVAASPTTD
jgi:RNA polymerase sigma-70 factor (ECF subfamily)